MTDTSFYVHPSSYIDSPCQIGKGTFIWHFSHIMPNCHIGQNCNIGQNVFIASEVTIGNKCKIQNNVSLYTGIRCEDNVFIGPSVVFTNVINPRAHVDRKNEYKPTIIKEGSSIGANATIVCGVTLGCYCFIGAGAVVLSDIPDFAVVVGNPSRQIGWISRDGLKLHFDENGLAICPASNDRYKRENNKVRLIK